MTAIKKEQEKHTTKYWLISASKDHVQTGVSTGIAQANHGNWHL
jgi:hypothetical protein